MHARTCVHLLGAFFGGESGNFLNSCHGQLGTLKFYRKFRGIEGILFGILVIIQ